jgi:hypothetical protein
MKRLIVRIGLGIAMGVLLWGGLPANQAMAATFLYSFTGLVDKVQGQLNPPFFVNGQNPPTMSASMTVESTPDLDTNPNNIFGEYKITSFNLHIDNSNLGGYNATTGSFNQLEIRDGTPGQDQLNVAVTAPNGDPVGAREPNLFFIKLHSSDTDTFASDALPTTAPGIDSFDLKNQWRLVFEPGGKAVSGFISAMSITAVPLPAAVILFGAGLIALVGLGAGSWRKRNNSLA